MHRCGKQYKQLKLDSSSQGLQAWPPNCLQKLWFDLWDMPLSPYSSLNVDSRLCQAFHSSQLGYLTASLFHLQVTSQRPLMQGHRKLEVQTVFVEADVFRNISKDCWEIHFKASKSININWFPVVNSILKASSFACSCTLDNTLWIFNTSLTLGELDS